MQQQGRACQRQSYGCDDHRYSVTLEKVVERSEKAEPDRRGLARRIEQRQRRRYQRDAAYECDQHAATSDQPKLGKAAVAGGQESKETDGSGGGGKSERGAGLFRCILQRQAQIILLMTFGAIAHAELNAEVDAQADEKHEKGNR